ncbi:MAG: UDP-N-acetylmuramoyl-L-alanyl-D-glutamate--2,6-diaminopimelate ligase, partial [Clostridium sp.]|nr:UDP-N-acetylmuramoyl-L-alanyl-D-glutamate--2,6-diaminopimelate ligase [Clostridium sp.]
MKLDKLLSDIEFYTDYDIKEFKDIEIENIYYDSRLASKDSLFIAIKGEAVDGHKYIKDAYNNGCRIFIVENDDLNTPKDCVVITTKNSRKTLSAISARFFDYPSEDITTIGITGTKGKTSVANLIKSVIESAGLACGVIGTNGISYKETRIKTINTTPESYEIQKHLKAMVDQGVQYVAIEVSSGGLKMNRADDIFFDLAIFTNISEDHIGPTEHKDFNEYISCKRKLFTQSKKSIINVDDEKSDLFIKSSINSPITYSIFKDSMYKAANINYHNDLTNLGSSFESLYNGEKKLFEIYMPGDFSIYNALSVIAASDYLKLDYRAVKKGFNKARVKGRSEIIETNRDFTVIIDYAHNGVSLKNILTSLRKYNPNRIITVVGSVGGRTYGRRKELGDVSFKYSDITILTSDNP